jgi:hypothetical protein
MTTYSDGFNLRNKTLAKLDDIADAIDGCLANVYQLTASSLLNTTSTTAEVITGLSQELTVDGGQAVLLAFSGTFSNNDTAQTVFEIERGTDNVGTTLLPVLATTATDGKLAPVSLIVIDTLPAAGTYTYAVKWSVASGDTAYLRTGHLAIAVLRVA